MCGIAAIRTTSGKVSLESLERAVASLSHRGPDGRGVWVSPGGEVGLGHTRLAIMDLEGGAQPIESEDGRLLVAANGEFYGFETIRRDLERRGHRFRTRTDSEIALHLYEDHGIDFTTYLRGQFAFVLWDESTHTLLAVRDRFGLKPLFYSESDGLLRIASEAKALFAAGLSPGWDRDGVYHVLHACPHGDRSLFAGVRQVPPGHMLISTPGATRMSRYWDVPAPESDRRGGRIGSSVVEQVHDLVHETVRLRMRADVPVGCLLSGGLDSSAVLGIAADCSPDPVAAFTVGFDVVEFDETNGAREAAEFASARHHVVSLGDKDFADHFAQTVAHAEMVQFNAHGTARYLLSRAVRQAGYKSVLAGEGADELFFGYEFTRAAARAQRVNKLRLATRLLRSPRRRYPGLHGASPWLARLATLLDLSPALLRRLTGGLANLRGLLSPDFVAEFDGFDVYREFYRACDEAAGISAWHPARQLTYLWFRSIFANYHLAADRIDMAHGTEVRFPFLDHVLFEFTQQLPLEALAEEEREKSLLREAVRPYIPDSVFLRDKKPFWAPPTSVRGSNPLSEFVQDTLRSDSLASLPFLERGRVLDLLETVPTLESSTHAFVDSLLLALSSLCVLQDHYGL